MQKTFKKAIACLLAVLMLICAVPFTATAAGPSQWWITDDVDPATVTDEPSYDGTHYCEGEDAGYGYANLLNLVDDGLDGDIRSNFKPVITVTTSNHGQNGISLKDAKLIKGEYYGADSAHTYEAVEAAGNILNPTKLTAGQRIVITLEVGGFNVLNVGQFKGTYNTEYLQAGYYKPTGKWTKLDPSLVDGDSVTVISDCNNFYATAISGVGKNVNASVGTFYIGITGRGYADAKDTYSNVISPRPFGKNGIVAMCMSFEVLQDCSLADVFNFETRNPDAGATGTFFKPYYDDTVTGPNKIAFGTYSDVFANPLVIWSGANGAATREFDVTVAPFSNGTVTMDGETVDPATGATKKIAENNVVTLTATPAANAQFVGWKANDGTTVSTEPSITAVVNANITYTPYFVVNDASTFVVKFVDAFENIVRVQTVTNGSEVIIPPVPARAGYTDGKWSLTEAQIADLTEDTVITPIYTKITEKEYTVTVPAGSTITVNGENRGTTTQVPYNTQVTVYNPKAASWKINGATVAYGDTYTFYVGADVELTIDETPVTVQTPVVGSVNIDVSADGKRVSFLATRKIDTAEGWVQVNAGFMYGTTGVTASTELVDVNGTSVKAVYTKTDSEQFSISFNVTAGKTYNGRAFITYKNAADEINVAYANLQTYNA